MKSLKENRRIIVVDDEPQVIESYKEILELPQETVAIKSSRSIGKNPDRQAPDLTFEITYVDTGEKALTAIQEGIADGKPFLGGFFDVRLGAGIDGIETVKRARQLDPRFLFVLVTAYQDRSFEEVYKIFGQDASTHWHILCKPFYRVEILQKAFYMISSWNMAKRNEESLKLAKTDSNKKLEILLSLLVEIVSRLKAKLKHTVEQNDLEKTKESLRSLEIDCLQLETTVRELDQLSHQKKAA